MISRRSLATIHIAKKDRRLDDDSYRDMLERVAGVRSAADLDEAGAQRVLAEFGRIGFVAGNLKAVRGRSAFDRRPIANKARAMWIGLHQLDEIERGTDTALAGFVKRITGKQAIAFCTNGELGKVVEALKAWLARVGASADDVHAKLDPQRNLVREQARRVDLAIQEGRASAHDLALLMARVPLIVHFDGPQLNVLAGQLGFHVRRLKVGRRHKSPSQPQGAATCPQSQEPSQPND